MGSCATWDLLLKRILARCASRPGFGHFDVTSYAVWICMNTERVCVVNASVSVLDYVSVGLRSIVLRWRGKTQLTLVSGLPAFGGDIAYTQRPELLHSATSCYVLISVNSIVLNESIAFAFAWCIFVKSLWRQDDLLEYFFFNFRMHICFEFPPYVFCSMLTFFQLLKFLL